MIDEGKWEGGPEGYYLRPHEGGGKVITITKKKPEGGEYE